MICIGHRGAPGHEPENTLLSFQRAIELGAPWIEADVFQVDGRLVVIHDDRLERTTNGTGHVSERSFEYIRSLDAGKGQRVPTLDEVFDLTDCGVGINIEIKGPGTAGPLIELMRRYISSGWSYDRIIVSSFDHSELQKLRDLSSDVQIGILLADPASDYKGIAEKLNAFSLHCPFHIVNADIVADVHRRGLRLFVYTVNEPSDISRMKSLGVDGVFTDYPERAIDS